MVGYSEDSSDSEKKLFSPKNRGLPVSRNSANDQNSEVSTTHGIVVHNRSPSGESPIKQSRKTNDSEPLKHMRNIKTEKFSDSEGEDRVLDSRDASRTQKNSSDDDQVQTVAHDSDDTGKIFHKRDVKEPVKKHKITFKKEVISSEDEETIIQRDPDDAIISPQQKLRIFEDAGAKSDSETEIQPSQYWLHYHKENEKKEDDTTLVNNKNSHSEDSGERKKIVSRKSPPRITKTEIISTKYNRVNQQRPEITEESLNDAEVFDKLVKIPKKEPNVSKKSSVSNKRNEKMMQENENSEDNRSDGDESDTSKKTAPKKQTPNSNSKPATKTPASPKRKLSLKAVTINKKTDKISPAKKKMSESLSKKPILKRESICDKDTTSEEDEERVEKPEVPAKYVLALQKPKKSGSAPNGRQTTLVAKVNDKTEKDGKTKVVSQKRQTPKVSATPRVVNNVSKDSSSNEISSDEEPKPKIQTKVSLEKKQQVGSSSEDESFVGEEQEAPIRRPPTGAAAAAASLKRRLDSKVSRTKEKSPSNSSDEEDEGKSPSVKRAALSQKRETIAHSSSTRLAAASLERKVAPKVSPTKKEPASSSSDGEEKRQTPPVKKATSNQQTVASMGKKLVTKVSPTKKKSASSSSSAEDEQRETSPVKKTAAKQKHGTIARSLSTGSATASSKIKLDAKVSPRKKEAAEASSSSSDEAEAREASTLKQQERIKSPLSLKRKLDLDETLGADKTAEPESSKRAKRTPASKSPSHTMSDSDGNDSLTKLNTTLNKSIALAVIENGSESTVEVKKRGSKETRKSVSINTKHKTKHVRNDTTSRKSILKKPEISLTEGDTESDSISQEQNIEEEMEPSQEQTPDEEVEPSQEQAVEETAKPVVVPPKIIKRPLNLGELKKRENLTYDNAKASFRLEDLSDDDEIYILDVPRTVDPKELKGQTIRLGGKNTFQIEDQLYETCAKDATDVSCVFRTGEDGSSYKTVIIKPAGFINVRQKLSKALQAELKPLEKRSVPFPENLKIRHPLFGAAFKDKIVSANMQVSKDRRPGSIIKNSVSITAKTSKAAKPKEQTTKEKRKKRESSERLIIKTEIESEPKAKVKKTQKLATTKEASSDSDSDGGFFQQIKREVEVDQTKDGRDFKNLSSILNLDDDPSDPDLPTEELEETVILKRPKLSAKKKVELSIDESAIKHKSFDVHSKHSLFFSSTPIKVEKDDKSYRDEIPVAKVRKRKNHSVS